MNFLPRTMAASVILACLLGWAATPGVSEASTPKRKTKPRTASSLPKCTKQLKNATLTTKGVSYRCTKSKSKYAWVKLKNQPAPSPTAVAVTAPTIPAAAAVTTIPATTIQPTATSTLPTAPITTAVPTTPSTLAPTIPPTTAPNPTTTDPAATRQSVIVTVTGDPGNKASYDIRCTTSTRDYGFGATVTVGDTGGLTGIPTPAICTLTVTSATNAAGATVTSSLTDNSGVTTDGRVVLNAPPAQPGTITINTPRTIRPPITVTPPGTNPPVGP